MKAKTKFLKMYHKLPVQARIELVYNFSSNPMNLIVCRFEIAAETELGKKILLVLGYVDD